MNLVKAVALGLVSLTVVLLLSAVPLLVSMLKYGATLSPPIGDGYYVVLHWDVWRVLCVPVIVFAVPFFWRYRRTR